MRNLFGRLILVTISLLTTLVVVAPTPASAAPFDLYVGYADGIRGAVTFPSPWLGDANVTFLGASPSDTDAGAILIANTSGAALTINSVGVTINGTPATPPWALSLPVTLGVGGFLVLTETVNYNFDTSDIHMIEPFGTAASGCGIACPVVSINWGGG